MLKSWTKLITKSGPKFNAILKRLQEISIPQVAEQYIELRQRVIVAKLEYFNNQRDSLPNYSISLNNTYSQWGYQAGSDNVLSQNWA
jgi:hypothetical protein